MALFVNTNINALRAMGDLSGTQRGLSDTFRKISSGQRVNTAADDAAGLAVAENLDAKERSARVANRNIQDGISVIQTYEGAVDEIADILKRQRELAVQSSSETLTNIERDYLHAEFYAMHLEHRRIAATTDFNGQALADKTKVGGTDVPSIPPWGGGGTFGIPPKKSYGIQVGVNGSAHDQIAIEFNTLDIDSMQENFLYHQVGSGVTWGAGINQVAWVYVKEDAASERVDWDSNNGRYIGVASAEQAQASIEAVDIQIDHLNSSRSKVGAFQNRLESALKNLETFTENTAAAESRIRDADFAFETAEMSKLQVVQQAGTAILGQANGMNRAALRLI